MSQTHSRLSNSAIYWTSTPSWPPSCPGGLQTRRLHSHSPLHAWPGAPEARRPTCADDTGHTRPCAFGPEQERRPQTCMPHPPALLLLPPEVHIAYYPTPTRWTPLTQALHASAQWPASRRPQRRCLSRAELRLSLLVAGRAWSCRTGLITQLAPPTPSPPSTRLHAYNFPTEGSESAAAVCVVCVVVRPRSGAPDRQ